MITLAKCKPILTVFSLLHSEIKCGACWNKYYRLTHRRNNHGDQGRQVPPNFWGTSNALVPRNFFGHNFQHMHEICVKPTCYMRQCNIFDTLVIFRIEFHASAVCGMTYYTCPDAAICTHGVWQWTPHDQLGSCSVAGTDVDKPSSHGPFDGRHLTAVSLTARLNREPSTAKNCLKKHCVFSWTTAVKRPVWTESRQWRPSFGH